MNIEVIFLDKKTNEKITINLEGDDNNLNVNLDSNGVAFTKRLSDNEDIALIAASFIDSIGEIQR